MFYNDHQPSHFHARYDGRRAIVSIEDLAVLSGELPPRALALVVEWASHHRAELRDDWERARRHQSLVGIAPLE